MSKMRPVSGAAVRRADVGIAVPGRLGLEGICRRFGKMNAVLDVDFELAPAEIVCLLGPSGCGKTTLLRIAAGLERQSAGRVLIDGEEIAGPVRYLPPEERGVGLMFQDYALFPHLSILDNVAYGLSRFDRRERGDLARMALSRVGLSDLATAYPHTLSGGEQQRAALARVIAPRPRVLLMDEPFSGLDRGLREIVRDDTLSVLKETGASAILVTHDPEEAMLLADRIALMRSGRLVQVGSPHDLYFHPVDPETTGFFSETNSFSGVVSDGRVTTPLGLISAPDLADGTHVQVLVREQGVVLADPESGVPANVRSVRFVGEVTRIVVEIESTRESVRLRAPGMSRITPGTIIGIVPDPEMTHVFEQINHQG